MWSTLRAPLSTSVQRLAIAGDQLRVVGERRPGGSPRTRRRDPLELQLDDLPHDVVGQREVRHQRHAAEERRLEGLQQLRVQRLGQRRRRRGASPDRRRAS